MTDVWNWRQWMEITVKKTLSGKVILALVLYGLASSPLVFLLLQSNQYRLETGEELTRKIAHIRPLRYAFLGDSLTAGRNWGWALGGSPFCALNLGSPGRTISQIQGELDDAMRFNPRLAFVLAGTNDLITGRTDEEMMADYTAFFRHAEELHFRMLIVTSLPFQRSSGEDARILGINERLRALVEARGWKFVDLNSAILREPDRSGLYLEDGVHFSPRMYGLWVRLLKENA